jgi:glycosyltransferase involved in cell wall biosynthesis
MATAPSTLLTPPPAATARRKLNVAIVDEELPYPLTSGKRIRTMGLVQRLARRHRLTYVCHRNADEDEAYRAVEYFNALGICTLVVDRPVPPKSGAGFYGRLAANLLSPLPYSVTSHTSRALTGALRDLARSEPIDLWHCEWTPYAHALRAVAGRRVVMAHNVESIIWQRYHETETNPLKRWYIARQWKKFVRFERDVLRGADLTVAVSDLDADRFRDDLGVPRVDVVDNGVDTDYFRPTGGPREPATLLFLGSLEWRPNLDGVAQLLDRVFPEVRSHLPDAKLLLVGRNPPDWLRRVTHPGVEVHADVPDVRPFLARSTMLVVPLRIGGGSRLKILEALASGTPVVSTRVGAEGLHLDENHLTLTEDVGGLAGAVLDTVRDPRSAASRTDAGRRVVLERYDWEALADRLERLWSAVARLGDNR